MKIYSATVTLELIAMVSVAGNPTALNTPSEVGPIAPDSSGSLYMGETVLVTPTTRDKFVSCLQEVARTSWKRSQQAGDLADVSVYETTRVSIPEAGSPDWNFLILTHLPMRLSLQSHASARKVMSLSATRCAKIDGVETRRVEMLRPTPKSSYPRTSPADDRAAVERQVEFVIEYIAVNDTETALAAYRESMGRNMGPAMGIMIPNGTFFSFLALETVAVEFTQPSMMRWNQIHIRGFYPEKGQSSPGTDSVLRFVNPGGAGAAGFFGELQGIRTKPREDIATQLVELAVH